MPDRTCVVVGEPGPVESIFGNVVPFFAGNFAGLAANAERRIGEEGCRCHFLDSVMDSARVCGPSVRRPGLTLQTNALLSMMRTFGSSLIASKSFTTSPLTVPRYPQWYGS